MSRLATAWVVIAAVSVGTFALRASSLVPEGSGSRFGPRLREALRMVPAAALAALVAPAVFGDGGGALVVDGRAVAAAVALVVAWRTRNVLLTIVVGLAIVVGWEQLLG